MGKPMTSRERRGLAVLAIAALLTAGGGLAWRMLRTTADPVPPQPTVVSVTDSTADSGQSNEKKKKRKKKKRKSGSGKARKSAPPSYRDMLNDTIP